MKPLPPQASLVFGLLVVFLTGCISPDRRVVPRFDRVELRQAHYSIKQGRKPVLPAEERAGHLIDAASAIASVLNDSLPEDEERNARILYNRAAAELTVLLRDNPRLWRSGSIALPSPRGEKGEGADSYQLQILTGSKTTWDPGYFTSFKPAHRVNRSGFRQHIFTPGYGGALVGVRRPEAIGQPPELFAERGTLTAPVTSVVGFQTSAKGDAPRRVTLALADPSKVEETTLAGKKRTLSADFTAPLAYAPRKSEFWTGLQAMINVERYLGREGLYMLQPYDPDRIPVIFVHGLASTPQMWLNVINELEADPVLRARYQPWTYGYPSGLPLVYSALRLREQLAIIDRIYPLNRGYVLVGHSLGGLVSRLQVSGVERRFWDATFGNRADQLYRSVPEDSLLKRATVFDSDPNARRAIFICVPHRGSTLAVGSLGDLATRLIHLPSAMIGNFQNALGGSLELITGVRGNRFPTSIQNLSPKSPILGALNDIEPTVPHHSIIGDRGRGDSPDSSDGIVPYWSSHLDTATSELIVPGPHGSYQLPQTIEELRRLLLLELKTDREVPSSKR